LTGNMRAFIETGTALDQILAHKVEEISERKKRISLDEIIAAVAGLDQSARFPRDFTGALRRAADRGEVALIAEVKKASPSKGVLIEDFDPVQIGSLYANSGAAAISVLTDEDFFQGHLDYMTAVRATVPVPVLRKDFIIDPFQVYEGRLAGADAVLLIVATLEDSRLADLQALANDLGMAALVEVHTEAEMERALKLNAVLIGINNRDLRTFQVDLQTTARLARLAPQGVTLVAESGIASGEDVAHMGQLGAHAVLVGEALVRAGDIAGAVREFSGQKR
jgi:indole-3-glycerol phosphate synthase